ncbi:MAG: general stress protein CsbD [Imperialibacter sp.]|uniref:general stress protein CsbD n=1 Tax=Imperialibacter sp. TaxID=2038411 RepID=UPI0032EDF0D5
MATAKIKAAGVFKITGDWADQSGLLKQKFGLLTDEDLVFEAGGEQDLLTRICERINKDSEEVMNIIRKGLPFENKA